MIARISHISTLQCHASI